jgi:hypothetical protein
LGKQPWIYGKSGPDFSPIRPLFQEHFTKLTGFWEMLNFLNFEFRLKAVLKISVKNR